MTSKRASAWLAALFISAGGASAAQAQDISSLPPEVLHYADTVIYNGKIITADKTFTIVEAVAVRDNRFLAVGPTSQILPLAGPKTRRIDLKGKTVTPGIIDMHGGPGGASMIRYWTNKYMPNEKRWRNKPQALEGIKRSIARVKPGDPVILPVYELGFDVDAGAGGRAGVVCDVFTLAEIDAISPDNPVFFLRTVNQVTMAMNSKAAEVTKRFLPKGVETPFLKKNDMCVGIGPQVDGILQPGQWAGDDYVYWVEPVAGLLDVYREDVKRFSMRGITTGKQHMGFPLFSGIHALWERGELNMRFRMPFAMTPQISGHTTELPPDQDAETFFRKWANLSRMGDDMLRFNGVRIPSVGGNTPGGDAWMIDRKINTYPDRWGNDAPFGGRLPEQQAVESGSKQTFRARDILINATRFGWDVSCDHCVGDRAFREVLSAYEEGLATQIVHRPNQRLTTNHTPMVNQADIARAAKMGIWSSISTGHAFGGRDGADMEAALIQYGADRLARVAAPVESFIKAGLHPSLEGTIWPDADAAGKSGFWFIGKAITRKDEVHGRVWNKDEKLTRQQALWAATLWSADQLAEVDRLGSIEKGKLADLVIIDRDYLTVPEDDIQETKVLLTMVDGRIVWEVPNALANTN